MTDEVRIETHWPAAWVNILIRDMGPLLKNIKFSEYETELQIHTYTKDPEVRSTVPGMAMVRITINANAEFFRDTLKMGSLPERRVVYSLQSLAYNEFGYDLNSMPDEEMA